MTGSIAAKMQWRERLSALRRSRPAGERHTQRRANGAHLRAALEGIPLVCAFLPLGSEPLARELLDELAGSGSTVLVPVVTGAAPLDWVRYPAPLRPGPAGIAEPVGPRLGSSAVRAADVILVPALAVDETGVRLGRGGGHYDRTLALLDQGRLDQGRLDQGRLDQGRLDPDRLGLGAVDAAPSPDPRPPARPWTAAVLFDGELVPRLPFDRFDMPVDRVVTPGGGLQDLDRRR